MAEADFLKKVSKLSGGEVPLILLEINHSELDETIYIVNDREELVRNTGGSPSQITYQPIAFRAQFLNQPDGSSPTAQLAIDNVGNILTDWINVSNGARGTTITIGSVLRSAPDVFEIPQATVYVSSITITKDEVRATLAPLDLVNRRINPIVHSQLTSRGLY